MELSKELQTALFKTIHQTKGISPKEIAQLTGDSHNTILNYANMNMENHLPSLKKFEAIINFTQNPEMVRVLAHSLGCVLVPVGMKGDNHRELSIIEAMLQTTIAAGQATKTVYDVLEDNVVTPQEYEEAHEFLKQIQEFAAATDEALKKAASKYISPNLDKEKA